MRNIDLTTGSLALGATVLLGAFLLAPAAEADTQAASSRSSAASSSRSSSASSGSTASRSSGSSVSSSSRSSSASRGAAVTRSSGRRSTPGSPTVVRGTARHRHATGGRFYGGYRGYPYYSRYYGYSHYPFTYGRYDPWGWSFGLGWWGGYYAPYLSYGYGYGYPYPPPRYYGYGRPVRVEAEPVGAFDLNVKPKKAEVWVDGRFVGNVGRFDGFPDYLWLDEGEHQLVFYLEGYRTVERRVETLAGVVADLRLVMERGPSIPPRQLATRPVPPPAGAGPPAAVGPGPAQPPAAAAGGSLDLRRAPGRLVLSIEPADASVYLDGRYLGTGRELAQLHAGLLIDSGDHRLEVVRPGFEGRAIEFSVAEGEEERIEVGLERG